MTGGGQGFLKAGAGKDTSGGCGTAEALSGTVGGRDDSLCQSAILTPIFGTFGTSIGMYMQTYVRRALYL